MSVVIRCGWAQQHLCKKMDPLTVDSVCVRTNLAASVDVEQTHPASQLLGILDAVPQNTGGEIEGAFIRLHKKNTHTHTN